MLSYLAIHNLALVEHARFEPRAGLNVLTGESGAGKSIVLDALAFVAGASRARCQVRAGADSGSVEAEFVFPEAERPSWRQLLARYDLPLEEDLVLSRKLDKSGKTRCFVQGRLVPRTTLAELCAHLIEFSDQGDSHALRSPAAQLRLLDACLGLEVFADATSRAYDGWRALTTKCEVARQVSDEAERRRDFLEYQLGELRSAGVEDYAALQERIAEMADARGIHDACRDLKSTLGGGEQAVLSRLTDAARRLIHIPETERALLEGHLNRALDALHELFQESRRLEAGHDFPEREAAIIEEQLITLRDLARKHRVTPEELGARAEALELELEEARRARERHSALEEETRSARREAERLARELDERRRAGASQLEKRVLGELQALGLKNASLGLRFSETELGPQGITHLEIAYASHPGALGQPLGRIASGGELGRVLLALRLATEVRRPLLVLDEIDAGSGGEAATQIGESLKRAAELGQLLAVTHWPQVASRAAGHFAVRKTTTSAGAESSIHTLDGESRVDEIGRMLGGDATTARPHAEMLLRASSPLANARAAASPKAAAPATTVSAAASSKGKVEAKSGAVAKETAAKTRRRKLSLVHAA